MDERRNSHGRKLSCNRDGLSLLCHNKIYHNYNEASVDIVVNRRVK
jgi:hypothetical protein